MPQFPQSLSFDLPNAFARHRKRLADFLERMLAAIFQTEAHLNDFFFARSQGAQHLAGLVLQIDVDHRFRRRDHSTVLDEVA
jgi:hypothetical protein